MASAISAARSRPGAANGFSSPGTARVKMLLVFVFHAFAPMVKALPLPFAGLTHALAEEAHPNNDASLVLYLGIAIALVLAGGVFAGLTIA